MRKELEQIEKIEQYLKGSLSSAEKNAFETELSVNPTLQNQLAIQQDLVENIERIGLRSDAKLAYKKYLIKKISLISAAVIGTIALITLAIIYFSKPQDEPVQDDFRMDGEIGIEAVTPASPTFEEEIADPLLDDEIEQSDSLYLEDIRVIDEIPGAFKSKSTNAEEPIAQLKPNQILLPTNDPIFADANSRLNQELFEIQTDHDTIIESENGIVVYIPANAFDTKANQVDFILQEALTPSDIMYAGLNTMTKNGDELETGGMFYIDAFANGKRVSLLKQLTADIPSNPLKTGMQLYEGEKDKAGQILWKDPKDLRKPLTPVEITDLDFYPPGYEKQMNRWGYWNKDFIDSLYYSFDEVQMVDIEAFVTAINDLNKGENLFNNNCSSCHFPNRDMTAPALKGARERWIKNSTEENFYAWIKRPSSVIQSGDQYANELFIKWQTIMTPHALTNEQIDLIFKYVESFSAENTENLIPPLIVKSTKSVRINGILNVEEVIDTISQSETILNHSVYGVKPSSVRTIWNKKFNNTNLATKEFEARMPWIHRTCNTQILELYINNLNKNLSEVDKMAADALDGMLKTKFLEFAALEQGSVETSSTAQKELNAYYQTKQKALEEIARLTNEKYWQMQDSLDNALGRQITAANDRNLMNKNALDQKEIAFNTDRVYKQLGMQKPKPRANPLVQFANQDVTQRDRLPFTPIMPNRTIVRSTITNLGWKNVDCLMSVSLARESVKIKSFNRTAEVKYSSLNLKISNANKFDNINVYVIPKAFNSFVKLEANGSNYNFSLNDNLAYRTVAIAWNSDGFYTYLDGNTTAGSETIVLEKKTKEQWEKHLKSTLSSIKGMDEEIDFLEYLKADKNRQNINKDKRDLKRKAEPYIFPCADTTFVQNDANFDVVATSSVSSEVQPSFPGADPAMISFINKNLRLPEGIQVNGPVTIYVGFTVEIDGSLTDIKILKGVDPLLDAEVIRIVKLMPKWTPAGSDDQPIAVKFTLPITLELR